MSVRTADELGLSVWRWRALAGGIMALVVVILGVAASPTRFFQAYLPAYLFCLGLTLGSMALLMIYHLTGGAWGFLIRRILEASVRNLPLCAILFLPVALGVEQLYPWARPGLAASELGAGPAHIYLNPRGFWIRAAVCFIVWSVVALALDRCSRRQDSTGRQQLVPWLRALSGFGLLAYGVGMNFASVDWVMSLQIPFHSTIFGPLMAAGHLLSALAFSILILARLARRAPMAQAVSPAAVNDLGSLLFAFLVVWSYMVWFQFMLIWIADLPTDVMWYLPRSSGGWQWVAYALLTFGFVIPLSVLLVRRLKRDLKLLARVAALILLTQLAYDFYLVIPAFPDSTIVNNWMDFLTPVALGGIWLAAFLWQLDRQSFLPRCDFNQNEALLLRHKNDQQVLREQALAS